MMSRRHSVARRLVAARRLAVLAVLALAAHPAAAAEAPAAVAAQLRDRALADGWSYSFLEGLTSEIGQRLAGTEAEARAANWAQAQLAAAGFTSVRQERVPMTAWLRGAETAEVEAPTPQSLVVTALGGSVATPAAGIIAPIALFRSYGALLAEKPGALTGKIAVVTQRMVRTEDGTGYGVAAPIRRAGPSEAARRGAVAYLLRSLGTDEHRLAHTGALDYAADATRIPAAALANPDADQLERLAARGPVRVRLVLTPRTEDGAEAHTVVAEVRGRERPEEVVLIGAHLDSWDLGTGATDDGAGAAIVAGAGRLIAALPRHPRRTLRVVLFGAEEMDWSGPAYAAAHRGETPRLVLAGESDFGAARAYAVALPPGATGSPFARDLLEVLTPLGMFLDRAPARFSGDDVRGLQAAGVPVFSVRQNGFAYFDTHHTADDTLDKVDPRGLAQNVAAWTAFAYLAAESDVDFRALATAGRH